MTVSRLSRRTLSLAVAGALLTSWHAGAAPVVADGVHVDVRDTFAEGNPVDWNHGLSAVNGGTITATNVTATGTGANFSHGVHAEGAGSHVDFTGGSASASGMNSNGVGVREGGSATITGTTISTSGDVSAGVRAINAGSTVTFSNVDVSTGGYGSHALLAMDGASMLGGGARLDTRGDFADGVHVLGGAVFRGSQLDIHTTGEQSRGVATGDAGSLLSITDSTIFTEGLRSHGARARDGAVLEISDTQVTTRGAASKGAEFEGGIGIIKGSSFDSTGHALDVWKAGQADVLDSSFATVLEGAYGMRVMQDGTLTVAGSQVTTSGREAVGVTARTGGHAELVDTTIETHGDLAHGIDVRDGGTVIARNVAITTQGANMAYGVNADGVGSEVDFTGGLIVTEGESSNGAAALNGGRVVMDGTRIAGQGDYIAGAVAELGGQMDVRNASIVLQGGSTQHGVDSRDAGSQLDVRDTRIDMSGENGSGMFANLDGRLDAQRVEVVTRGDRGDAVRLGNGTVTVRESTLSTTGINANGVNTNAGGTATVSGTDIRTAGSGSHGVKGSGTASATTLLGGTVTTSGAASRGVQADRGAHVRLDSVAVQTGSTTDGKDSHGIYVSTAGTAAVANTSIRTLGERSRGLLADGSGSTISGTNVAIETTGYQSYGVLAQAGSGVDVQGVRIETSGQNGHGIVSLSGATVTATDAFVETNALSAYALSAGTGASIGIDRGTVRALGDSSLAVLSVANAGETTSVALAHTDVYAEQATTFQVRGDGINDISLRGSRAASGKGNLLRDALDGSGTVNFSAAASELDGDIVFSEGYTSNLILGEGTLLRGAAQYVDDLQLSDSRWEMTGDSLVGNLSARNSTIAFTHDDGTFKTLTVTGDYVGDNALLQMNTVLGEDGSSTDRLHVLGNTAGQTGIAVNNIGGAGALTHDGIQLVQVDGVSNGSFNLVGRAVGGAYEYFLHKGGITDPTDGDWYLRSALPVDPPVDPGTDPVVVTPPVDPDPCFSLACVDPEGPSPSLVQRPETGAYLANQAAAVGMFDHSMHQRLGEPNLAERLKSDDLLGSAWLRTTTDHTRFNAADGQLDVGTHHSMLQAGTDLAKWGQDSRGLAGVMLATGTSTTQSTSNLTGYGAKGTVDGNAVGLYATWFQRPAEQTGVYVDAWVQASRFKNTVQGDALARERYDSKATTASLEAGYAFKVRQSANSALYVEPQAQVTWTDFSMDDHMERNGTRVRSLEAGGLQTRLGLRVYGHNTATSGNRVQPFVGINWIRTRGEGNSLALDETYQAGGQPRDVYQAKAGAQLQLGGGWTGWGELSSTRGKGSYSNYGGQMGVKYSW
jgi:autotransporter family porin